MEKNKIFGDLDLYKDEGFFRSWPIGSLVLSGRNFTTASWFIHGS